MLRMNQIDEIKELQRQGLGPQEMAATAILDRLFHKAHIFNIDGHSYRLKDFNQTIKGAHLE